MEHTQTNIYLSLQRLVWSVFLGVLSFQIIVPYVWSYINTILGIPFYTGYISFILTYAIFLPIITSVWLFYNNAELKACLFPIEAEDKVDRLSKFFLLGLRISLLLQVIVILIFILLYEISSCHFGIIQFLVSAISVLVFGLGALITIKRVKLFANEPIDKARKLIKLRAFRTLAGWALFSILILVFELSHWEHNKENNYYTGTKEQVKKGFDLLCERVLMDTLLKEISYEQEAILETKNRYALLALTNDTSSPARNILLQIKSSILLDPTKSMESDSTNKVLMEETVFKTLTELVTTKSELTLKAAQKIIGRQLRDSQLKITYLLLNVLLILISLIIFLQIDSLIKQYECIEPSRLAKLHPQKTEYQETLYQMEVKRNSSLKLSNEIWLYLTISMWLIIPLFKPVEDDKIDTKAPFKMLTLSGPDPMWREARIDNNEFRINNSFNNTIDSVQIKIDHNYAGDTTIVSPPDLTEIQQSLNKIKIDTEKVIEQNEKLLDSSKWIKGKVKYLTPN